MSTSDSTPSFTDGESIPSEVWADIPGFTGYSVSDHGRVRSRKIQNGRGRLRSAWRLMSCKPDQHGYPKVTLYQDGRQHILAVHQLVMRAFGPPPDGDLRVRHLNGDKTDNRLANLAWGTARENSADTQIHRCGKYGERNPTAKLSDAQVAEIKARAAGMGRGRVKLLADGYGVTSGLICRILRGHSRCHVAPAQPQREGRQLLIPFGD